MSSTMSSTRVLGDAPALGHHEGDRVADVADLVGGQRVERRRVHARDDGRSRIVRPGRTGSVRPGDVLTGVDGHDPGQRPGLGGVDREQPAVGHRSCAGTRRAASPAARCRRRSGPSRVRMRGSSTRFTRAPTARAPSCSIVPPATSRGRPRRPPPGSRARIRHRRRHHPAPRGRRGSRHAPEPVERSRSGSA